MKVQPTVLDVLKASIDETAAFLFNEAPWENKDFYSA